MLQTSCRAIRICSSPSCLPAVIFLWALGRKYLQKKGPRQVSIRKKRWSHSLEYFTILVHYEIVQRLASSLKTFNIFNHYRMHIAIICLKPGVNMNCWEYFFNNPSLNTCQDQIKYVASCRNDAYIKHLQSWRRHAEFEYDSSNSTSPQISTGPPWHEQVLAQEP